MQQNHFPQTSQKISYAVAQRTCYLPAKIEIKKRNKDKEVESTEVPLGHEDEGTSLVAQMPLPLVSESDECSLDFAILLLIPEGVIAKGKKEGREEKRNEVRDMEKKALSSFFLRLGFGR